MVASLPQLPYVSIANGMQDQPNPSGICVELAVHHIGQRDDLMVMM